MWRGGWCDAIRNIEFKNEKFPQILTQLMDLEPLLCHMTLSISLRRLGNIFTNIEAMQHMMWMVIDRWNRHSFKSRRKLSKYKKKSRWLYCMQMIALFRVGWIESSRAQTSNNASDSKCCFSPPKMERHLIASLTSCCSLWLRSETSSAWIKST